MTGHFLIVADFSILARDLSATLERMGLGVPLIASSDAQAIEVLSKLDSEAEVALAVLHMAPEEFSRSNLRAVLNKSGTQIVMVESDGETEGSNPALSDAQKAGLQRRP
jgi:hypothetical protein